MDTGGLRRHTKSVNVKKPQVIEAFPEVDIREGADELTLRADEVHTHQAFINTKQNELERRSLRTGTPSYKEIEGDEWEKLHYHYRDMSKATGSKNASRSQKVKELGR